MGALPDRATLAAGLARAGPPGRAGGSGAGARRAAGVQGAPRLQRGAGRGARHPAAHERQRLPDLSGRGRARAGAGSGLAGERRALSRVCRAAADRDHSSSSATASSAASSSAPDRISTWCSFTTCRKTPVSFCIGWCAGCCTSSPCLPTSAASTRWTCACGPPANRAPWCRAWTRFVTISSRGLGLGASGPGTGAGVAGDRGLLERFEAVRREVLCRRAMPASCA
jgi:hypothetical protein